MGVAVAFPNLQPTARSYSPGVYPKNEFQALNGAVTILRYGNRRTSAELSLSFDNIRDSDAALLLANYEQQNVGDNWVTFATANGMIGAGYSLAGYLGETGSGLRWRYAEPPSVDSVFPGLSTVKARFKADLDA